MNLEYIYAIENGKAAKFEEAIQELLDLTDRPVDEYQVREYDFYTHFTFPPHVLNRDFINILDIAERNL